MHSSYRKCPQCGDVIEGRPNKKFCSDACKGRHFRENIIASADADTNVRVSQWPAESQHSDYYETVDLQDECEQQDETGIEEAERRIQADKKLAKDLHEQFYTFVNDFLQVEGQLLTARSTNRLLQRVDRVIAAYQTHPYLKLSGNLVSRRLKELYGIHDILQEVVREIAGKILWQSKESHFELTNKWRKLLRSLLILD